MLCNPVLITVYIITYNRSLLLKRAIESVISQKYCNLDIIVINDNSSDNTEEILEFYSKKDHRIRYYTNSSNSGACFSRNKAISMAKGFYITGLDDDDYFLPDRIENFSNKAWLLGEENIILYSDVLWKTKKGFNKAKINNFFPKKITHQDLLLFNFIGNQIFTKTKTLKDNLFDVNMKSWQDLECWYSILKNSQKHAYKIDGYSYIQDISHPHERISTKKIDKIKESYAYFSDKHYLKKEDSILLANHLIMYGAPVSQSLKSIIYSLKSLKIHLLLIALRNFSFLVFKRGR